MLGLMLLACRLVSTCPARPLHRVDTHMAALSVFGLSFGLPAFALVKVVLPAFYARQDTVEDAGARRHRLADREHGVQRVVLAVLYLLWVPAESDRPILRRAVGSAGPAFRTRPGKRAARAT